MSALMIRSEKQITQLAWREKRRRKYVIESQLSTALKMTRPPLAGTSKQRVKVVDLWRKWSLAHRSS
jgi:hypothetical protein